MIGENEALLFLVVPERAEGIKRESKARETAKARRRQAIVMIN
jgi:hypothetical protein